MVKNFLENRKLRVKINNILSEKFTPQQGGSPLSPLLYNLYCHGVYNFNKNNQQHFNPQSYMLQFADDTTLVAHGKSLTETFQKLRTLVNDTTNWMLKWRVIPNPSKSALIIFNHKISNTSPTINMLNTVIKSQAFTKYLGIEIDNKLNFNRHTKIIKKKIITQDTSEL